MIALLLLLGQHAWPASAPAEPQSLVVLLTLPGCAPCERAKRELAGIEMEVHDLRQWNRRVSRNLRANAAPVVFVWPDRTKAGRRLTGSQITRGRVQSILGGVSERSGSLVRGRHRGRWTWPGHWSVAALEKHLRGPPHNYDGEMLASMTDGELVALHDAWHSGR